MSIGEKLLSLRKERELSQETLAEMLGVSRQTVSFWEKDQTLPTVDNLLRLRDIYGMSIDELLAVDKEDPSAAETCWTADGFDSVNRRLERKPLIFFWTICLLELIYTVYLWTSILTVADGVICGGMTALACIMLTITIVRTVGWQKAIAENRAITHRCVLCDGTLTCTVSREERVISVRFLLPSDLRSVRSHGDALLLCFDRFSTMIPKEILSDDPDAAAFLEPYRQQKQKARKTTEERK